MSVLDLAFRRMATCGCGSMSQLEKETPYIAPCQKIIAQKAGNQFFSMCTTLRMPQKGCNDN